MRGTVRVAAALAAGGVVLLLSSSCIKEMLAPQDRNRPPDTFITGAPAESSRTDGVLVHIFWRGYDPDGTVLSYQYAIDDTTFTNWHPTLKSDSVFLFKVLPDTPDVKHTFYIAAVDNQGKRDPTPAFRTFTAWDHDYPIVTATWGYYARPGGVPVRFNPGDTIPAPPPGSAPVDITLDWTGNDADGWITRYYWGLADAAQSPVLYADTTVVDMGSLSPKQPDDRTRHVVTITAEDNAGLRGGGGPGGVLAAEFPFVVDFTPRTRLDSIAVTRTLVGTAWDSIGLTHVQVNPASVPPQYFTSAQIQGSAGTPLVFPRSAQLALYYRSHDPEDGCVHDVYWQADDGSMASGTSSLPEIPGPCVADTSMGSIAAGPLTGDVSSSAFKLEVRARDAYLRREEYSPSATPPNRVHFLVDALPVVSLPTYQVNGVTKAVTFQWHATDIDEDYPDIHYRVSLDGGQRVDVTEGLGGASWTATPSDTTSGSAHTFEVSAANDVSKGRFSVVDLQFNLP